jgi:hypothetical protein
MLVYIRSPTPTTTTNECHVAPGSGFDLIEKAASGSPKASTLASHSTHQLPRAPQSPRHLYSGTVHHVVKVPSTLAYNTESRRGPPLATHLWSNPP